jgi:hypothetical protein
MIPTAVMMKLATLGLSSDHAEAVASMLTAVEQATREEAGSALEARRAADRERKSRQRHGTSRDITGQDVTSSETPSPKKRKVSPCTPSKEKNNPIPGSSEADASSEPTARDDEQLAFDAWNETAHRCGLPVAEKLTADRRSKLKARLADANGLEGWIQALTRLAASAFCTGRKTDFRADLDFVLQAKSFTRLVEGSYDDNRNQRGQHEQRNSHSHRGPSGLADHLGNIVARNELRDAEFEDRQGQRWAPDVLPSRELSLVRGDGGGHSFDQRSPLRAVGGRDFR